MTNPYVPDEVALAPGDLARSDDVNSRYESTVAGFDKLPTPAVGKRGFGEPVPVGDPTDADHAVTKSYMEDTWLTPADKVQLNLLNTTNLNSVAGSLASVNTVAANIADVNLAAANMPAILAAPTEAESAAESAAEAAASAASASAVLDSAVLEFDTVAEMVADTDIEIGKTIAVFDYATGNNSGVLFFKAVAAGTGAVDGGSYIDSAGVPTIQFHQNLSEIITPKMFGATGVGDDTLELQSTINYSNHIQIDNDFNFTTLTLSNDLRISGNGRLIGLNALGTKPAYSDIAAAANTLDRRSLLTSYTPNLISLTKGITLTGSAVIVNSMIEGFSLISKGSIVLTNCTAYNSQLSSVWRGVMDADNLISLDSSADGLLAQRGGVISADSSIVMFTSSRGMHVQYGGTIYANDSYCTNTATGNDALFVNGGGTIVAARSNILDNGRVGANVIYSGNINLEDAVISGNSGAGIVAESNGAIFAEGATITNNNKGISVSYGGFIQARNSTITGNTGLAVDGLTGGTINVSGATIDSTNNSGGLQIQMKAYGYCFSEAPGTAASGKDTLTYNQYSPLYGIVGNGVALIFDGDGADYSQYPNDKTGYSINRYLSARRETETISGGVITPSSSYILINGEGGLADDLDTITRDPNYPVDILFLSTASNVPITIKHNTGNVRTADGATDIVLDSKARSTILLWNNTLNIWSQPKFT